ncbi:MAG TPA: entericidin A/B family lipoprotein [Acetobacteraceae bacterium]|jgi:predicted small secreted protein
MRRKLAIGLAVATLLGSAPLLSACYTARGAGEDVKAAGQGLSNAAADHTHYTP